MPKFTNRIDGRVLFLRIMRYPNGVRELQDEFGNPTVLFKGNVIISTQLTYEALGNFGINEWIAEWIAAQ